MSEGGHKFKHFSPSFGPRDSVMARAARRAVSPFMSEYEVGLDWESASTWIAFRSRFVTRTAQQGSIVPARHDIGIWGESSLSVSAR